VAAAAERIAELETQSARRDAESAVEAACAAGKVTEPLRQWALAMAVDHRSLFDAWAQAAPVVVATGRTLPPDASGRVGVERVVATAARAEYRGCEALRALTSEEAYVADAIRRETAEL
jgi:hypothetical protein